MADGVLPSLGIRFGVLAIILVFVLAMVWAARARRQRAALTLDSAAAPAQAELDRPVPRRRKATPLSQMPPAYAIARIRRETRDWGIALLLFGGLMSGFQSLWSWLLILVGLMSFYFRDPAMFAVFGVTVAWSALSSGLSFMLGGMVAWPMIFLVQIYMVFQAFCRCRIYRRAQTSLLATSGEGQAEPDSLAARPMPSRAERVFPIAAAVLGDVSLAGISIVVVWFAVLGEAIPGVLMFAEPVLVNAAVLGLALGLAALLSRFEPTAPALIGMITSGVAIVLEIGLLVMFVLLPGGA